MPTWRKQRRRPRRKQQRRSRPNSEGRLCGLPGDSSFELCPHLRAQSFLADPLSQRGVVENTKMSAEGDAKKRLAALAALEYVEDGAIIGVGTGSTVNLFIEAL